MKSALLERIIQVVVHRAYGVPRNIDQLFTRRCRKNCLSIESGFW